MAITTAPSIVTSGLVVALDAANAKSYTGSGTTWTDLSGSGNTATLVGTPTFNSASGSFTLNGSSQYATVNAGANILPTAGYTKMAFIYPTSVAVPNNIISSATNAIHTFSLNNTNKLNAGHSGTFNTVVGATSLTINTWYSAAVTFSTSGGWVVYLNGIQDGTSATTTAFTGTGDLLIGGYNAAASWTGNIAYPMVYNRALTAAEILRNFVALRGRFGI